MKTPARGFYKHKIDTHIAVLGGSITLSCEYKRVELFLETCGVQLAVTRDQPSQNESRFLFQNISYDYNGDGTCGMTIDNITDEDNGLYQCTLTVPPDKFDYQLMDVTVIKPPSSIEIDIRPNSYFIDGDTLHASCIVRDVRPFTPVARWYLGDELLEISSLDTYTPDVVWKWPWSLQTVVQNISIQVSLKDDGLKLRCVVEHSFLNRTFQKSEVIHVYRTDYTGTSLIHARSPVSAPGSSTTMLCQGQAFTDTVQKGACLFLTTARSRELQFTGPDSVTSDGSSYYGQDLNAGHCGIRIDNVTDDNNGLYICIHTVMRHTDNVNMSAGMDTIVVAKLPSHVDLIVSSTHFIEGDVLSASCTVVDSRPTSLITWYLGDDVIRRDAVNDERDETWRWSWDTQTTTQHVTIRLGLRHDSTFLRCVAETLALKMSVEKVQLIIVNPYIPPGYEPICGFGIYKLHSDVTPYVTAEAACIAEGTRLASVDSVLEQDVLVTLMRRHANTFNFSDTAHRGVYTEDNIGGRVEIVSTQKQGTKRASSESKRNQTGVRMCAVLLCNNSVITGEACWKENAYICEKKQFGEGSIRIKVLNALSAASCFLHNITQFPLSSADLEEVAERADNLLRLNRTYMLQYVSATTVVQDIKTVLAKVVLDEGINAVVIDKSKVSLVVADVVKDLNPVQGILIKYDRANSSQTSISKDLLVEDIRRLKSENVSLYIRSPRLNGNYRLTYAIHGINFSFSSPRIINNETIQNGRVISVVNSKLDHSQREGSYVYIIFKSSNVKVYRKALLQSCAYWDFENEMWSTEGCELHYRNNILRACRCIYKPQEHDGISSNYYITYEYKTLIPKSLSMIGVALKRKYATSDLIWLGLWSISGFGIVSIGLTGFVYKKWRQQQSSQILLQMSVSSALYLTFNIFVLIFKYDPRIDDYQRSDSKKIVFSFLVRYSFLAQCTWVMVVSVLQLKRLINVLGTSTTEHLLLKVTLFAWGAPVLPLVVLLAWDQYQHFSVYNHVIYYTVVMAPQAIVVVVNLFILVYVSFHVCACCGCGEMKGLVRHGITDWTLALRRLKQTVFLFFLFGIPTSFELIYLFVYTNEIFLYAYRFFDTIQGFLLFIFFIIIDDDVRHKWKEIIFI